MSENVPPAERTESLPSSLGKTVGPYRLEGVLGRGGMGVVYAAVHQGIGKRVAVKMMDSIATSEPVQNARFLREAKACARVNHPGLVQLFDCQTTAQGTPYLVMELLRGQTLRTYLKAQPVLEVAVAVEIVRQLAAALCAVHAQGIVHRDLKPENLMLTALPDSTAKIGASGSKEVQVKILDFGIAKFIKNPPDSYQTSGDKNLIGTVTYMSPEQSLSEASIDARSDVYSLGVVLYEMLCGRPPFVADPGRLLFLHIHQAPLSPVEYRSDLPPALCALVLRMLAKVPARRPDMAAVYEELQDPGLQMGRPPGWRWLIASSYRRYLRPRVRRTHRYVARRRKTLAAVLGLAGYIFYCTPLSPPYAISSEDTDELHIPSVLRPRSLFFHRDSVIKDGWVRTHLDLNIGRDGRIDIDVFTYATAYTGAHVVHCYSLFDQSGQVLYSGGVPRCGVDRARTFFGTYDRFHPRHCVLSTIQLAPEVAQRVSSVKIFAKDRDEPWTFEFCNLAETKERIAETGEILPSKSSAKE